MGRPSLYAPEIAQAICDRIATGESLRSICKTDGMPAESTVRLWVLDDVGSSEGVEGFAALSTRAYQLGHASLAEQCIEIADDSKGDVWTDAEGNERTDTERVSRAKLRIDTRLRLLGKWSPKVYGERQVIAGDPDAPLQIQSIAVELIKPKPIEQKPA